MSSAVDDAPSQAARPVPLSKGHRITHWDPEDEYFWANGGSKIARRNMICSVITEHFGFAVWTMWSSLVLFLGPQYGLTPDQKFLLVVDPGRGRRRASHPLLDGRGEVRRPRLDDHLGLRAAAADDHRSIPAQAGRRLRRAGDAGGPRGRRRRQLRLVDVEHQCVLSRSVQGLRPRHQRRRGQPRRGGRPTTRPVRARHLRCGASPGPGRHLPPADHRLRTDRRVVHGQPGAPGQRQGRGAGGLPRAAHLGDLAALHRHVRLVHRLQLRLRPGTPGAVPGALQQGGHDRGRHEDGPGPGPGRLRDLPRPADRLESLDPSAAGWPTARAAPSSPSGRSSR